MAKDNNLRDFLGGIANAIRDKKGTVGDINAQDFEDEIATIQSGVELDLTDIDPSNPYFLYATGKFAVDDNLETLTEAWKNHDKQETYFDESLNFVMASDDLGMILSFYTGDNIDTFYDLCANGGIEMMETVKITLIDSVVGTIIVDGTKQDSPSNLRYVGDNQDALGTGTPLYLFAYGVNPLFALIDLGDLGFPLGKSILFIGEEENYTALKVESGFNKYYESGVIVPKGVEVIPEWAFLAEEELGRRGEDLLENNYSVVIPNSVTTIGTSAFYNWLANDKQVIIPNSVTTIGTSAFYNWLANDKQLIIPNSVTSIGNDAFNNWQSNNQPLVIPNSVTSIGVDAFSYWTSNNHPLVIPDSVTSIENNAFRNWTSNNQPLVIPDSVISIENWAFYNWTLVPYVEIQATTPPTLASSFAFGNQNDAPIYVPDESVTAYKTATNWNSLASRIKGISEMP